LESRGLVGLALVMVERFVLGWWHVTNGAVETAMVPPIDPGGGA
jgi:hypothetical protein